ncbi:MAG: DUF3667 domain-containing protein [Saprospiraceae bacterium]|nr:DUF3667 domain-containing protein [Saprospiraceae bacterium]
MNTCLHCDNQYEGNFCPECGQKATTARLTFHQIVHDLQHVLLHLDKGVLKNLKTIWMPSLIRDYIAGKRVGFYNPIVLLLFVCGILAYVEITFKVPIKVEAKPLRGEVYSIGYKIGKTAAAMFRDWSKYFEALMVLPLAFWSSQFYRVNTRYNLIENIYIQAFIVCNMSLIGLVFFPILRHSTPVVAFNLYSVLLLILFNFVTFTQETNWLHRTLKSTMVVLLAYLVYILAFVVAAFVVIKIWGL